MKYHGLTVFFWHLMVTLNRRLIKAPRFFVLDAVHRQNFNHRSAAKKLGDFMISDKKLWIFCLLTLDFPNDILWKILDLESFRCLQLFQFQDRRWQNDQTWSTRCGIEARGTISRRCHHRTTPKRENDAGKNGVPTKTDLRACPSACSGKPRNGVCLQFAVKHPESRKAPPP